MRHRFRMYVYLVCSHLICVLFFSSLFSFLWRKTKSILSRSEIVCVFNVAVFICSIGMVFFFIVNCELKRKWRWLTQILYCEFGMEQRRMSVRGRERSKATSCALYVNCCWWYGKENGVWLITWKVRKKKKRKDHHLNVSNSEIHRFSCNCRFASLRFVFLFFMRYNNSSANLIGHKISVCLSRMPLKNTVKRRRRRTRTRMRTRTTKEDKKGRKEKEKEKKRREKKKMLNSCFVIKYSRIKHIKSWYWITKSYKLKNGTISIQKYSLAATWYCWTESAAIHTIQPNTDTRTEHKKPMKRNGLMQKGCGQCEWKRDEDWKREREREEEMKRDEWR